MESVVSFNLASMPGLFNSLNVSEMKLVFVLAHYSCSRNKSVFVNSAENREWLASFGFKRTPERISTLLSSLARKGMLVKEGTGVYSLNKNIVAQ